MTLAPAVGLEYSMCSRFFHVETTLALAEELAPVHLLVVLGYFFMEMTLAPASCLLRWLLLYT